MMKKLLTVAVLVGGCAYADIVLKSAGTTKGPVGSLDCTTDGGITCGRNPNGSTAQLYCAPAASNSPGCILPIAQTLGTGAKTFPTSVITPLLDAGMAVIGSVNTQASTIANINTGASLVISSATADGTTSPTVGAMQLQCTASLTAGDICIDMQDSSGNHLMSVQQGGSVNFNSHVTTAGATAGAVGTDLNIAVGSGAGGSSSVAGGLGGALSASSGNGGAAGSCIAPTCVAGAGGQVLIRAGDGGTDNVSNPGGAGGSVKIFSGSGGLGGSSGSVQVIAGTAGAATLFHVAGNGSSTTVIGGKGGDSAGGNPATAGGGAVITGGQGGTDTVNYGAGAGGPLTLKSGTGGVAGSGSGASGGVVTLDTGAATGAAGAAAINIGTTNGGTVTIGRSGQIVLAPGVLRLSGVATGSLPACSGGSAGSFDYDTTLNQAVYCNGTSWQYTAGTTNVAHGSMAGVNRPSFSNSTDTVAHTNSGPVVLPIGTVFAYGFQALVVGGGAGSYTYSIFDEDASTTIATWSGQVCNALGSGQAGTATSVASVPANHHLSIRIIGGACTSTNPQVTADATW